MPIAFVAFVAGLAVILLLLWLAERSLCSSTLATLPLGSMLLTSLSMTIVMLILLFGSGLVQVAEGDANAWFVFKLRVITVFSMFIGPVICLVIGIFRLSFGGRLRIVWMIIAISSYALAWYVVNAYSFLPAA